MLEMFDEESLFEWGCLIRQKFDEDNLYLTMPSRGNPGSAHLIKAMGRSMSNMKSEMKSEISRLTAALAESQRLLGALLSRTPAASATYSTPLPVSESLPVSEPATTDPAANAAMPEAAPASAAPNTPARSSEAQPQTPELPSREPPQSRAFKSFGALLPQVAGSSPAVNSTDISVTVTGHAGNFYRALKARRGAVPSGFSSADKGRATRLYKWFEAMADPDEKALLGPPKAGFVPPDAGAQRQASDELHRLVDARVGHELSVQWGKRAKTMLTAASLENQLRKVKLHLATHAPSAQEFEQWRKQFLEREAEERAARSAGGAVTAKRQKIASGTPGSAEAAGIQGSTEASGTTGSAEASGSAGASPDV